jgi:UDP-N-acetylglucosamine transferase subunit ALG13
MIFVTVGTQLPFDRLVRGVDDWAAARGRTDVFAQIGPGVYEPRHIRWQRFVTPDEFRAHLDAAEAIVAHAGMGSILEALCNAKPILVMPRRCDLREHRNDHQLATVRRFLAMGRIRAAMDEHELGDKLDEIIRTAAAEPIGRYASPALIEAVRALILGGKEPGR